AGHFVGAGTERLEFGTAHRLTAFAEVDDIGHFVPEPSLRDRVVVRFQLPERTRFSAPRPIIIAPDRELKIEAFPPRFLTPPRRPAGFRLSGRRILSSRLPVRRGG